MSFSSDTSTSLKKFCQNFQRLCCEILGCEIMLDVVPETPKVATVVSSIANVEGNVSLSVDWCGSDKSKVLSSFACFLSFIIYGACMAALGASVPFLAIEYDKALSEFSVAFALRGGGYLVGTVYSAAVLEGFYGINWAPSPWYKKNMLILQCLMTLLLGVCTAVIVVGKSFHLSLFLFFVQGVSFGGCDTIANVIIPSLWGDRTQPWMQALHACFGIGALTGPALIGSIGMYSTLTVLAIGSLLPTALCIWYFHSTKGLGLTNCMTNCGELEIDEASSAENKDKDKDKVNDAEKGTVEEETLTTGVSSFDKDKPEAADKKKIPLPGLYKATITALFFVYVGAEASFGSWVSTYVLQQGLTVDEDQAAFVAAYYWAFLTVGRVLSIVLAIYMTASTMLNIQLVLSVIAGVLNVTIMSGSYNNAILCACMLGFALSSVFPLAMTVVGDYGYTMDAASTASFIIGSCVGDGTVPWLVGVFMGHYGPSSLPTISLVSVLGVCVLFIFFATSQYHGCADKDHSMSSVDVPPTDQVKDSSTEIVHASTSKGDDGGVEMSEVQSLVPKLQGQDQAFPANSV